MTLTGMVLIRFAPALQETTKRQISQSHLWSLGSWLITSVPISARCRKCMACFAGHAISLCFTPCACCNNRLHLHIHLHAINQSINQGFYSRWGQLAHLTKLRCFIRKRNRQKVTQTGTIIIRNLSFCMKQTNVHRINMSTKKLYCTSLG